MEITITLPDTIAIAMRSGVTESLDVTKLSAAIVARGAVMGLAQKSRNFAASALMNCKIRAAGAKRADETDAAYDKRVESMTIGTEDLNAEALACIKAGLERLYADDWGAERGAGEAGESMDMRPITYALAVYAAKLAADIPAWATLTKIADKRRAVNVWLDAKPGRRDAIMAKVAEEAALDI